MIRTLLTMCMSAISALCFAACSDSNEAATNNDGGNNKENDTTSVESRIETTAAVPAEYFAYEDLARAIEFIHDNATALGVSAEGYSLWGGSAGARMAATLGNRAYLRQLTGRTDIPQASAVIMQYTGYSAVSQYDASTYACVGNSDGIASWRTMQNRLQSLSALCIPTEFHAYQGLPHGFGLGIGTVAEGWIDDAVNFWQRQMGTTGINNAKANHKSQFSNIKSQTIYGIDGSRRDSLRRGINIVNDKKIIKR